MAISADPWSGVLDPDVHDKLVANINAVASRSGLGQQHKHLIWQSAAMEKSEQQWAEACIRTYQTDEVWNMPKLGIVYTGSQTEATERMKLIAGFLLRNFVDARVMTRAEALAERKEQGHVDADVLFIPDFAVTEYIQSMPKWERASMVELYQERTRDTLPTCLYRGCSPDTLKQVLPSIGDYIEHDFMVQK